MDPKIKLNVHLQVPSSSTQEGGGGSNTPNTPEIVNSIVNMTCGPFAADFASQNPTPLPPTTLATQVMSLDVPSPMIPSNQETLTYTDMDTSSNMSSSPASTPGSSLSVQAYTSQFIKEGLKIKMRQRIGSGSATPSPVKESVNLNAELEEYSKPKIKRIKLENLTPDDMNKRQRRRERNKIAATKCRNKKKARTVNLMKESETLDAQNKALKIEIGKLETEKSRLIDVLSRHQPNCAKKLKEIIKPNNYINSSSPEFRVPLPPASTVTSSGSITGLSGIPKIRMTPPDEPPSFADLIKEEEIDEPFTTMAPPGYSYGTNSDNFAVYPSQNHFLAKSHLGQTYLDLDSRCIAL